MNAGKSTTLLQSSYNYYERGMETLLFVPKIDDRYQTGQITSRIGLAEQAITIDNNTNLYGCVTKKLQHNSNIKCILVDEAQFLSKEHVQQLCNITDSLNLPVLAYGLRSDFQGEPFEGSKYLLVWADTLLELKTICHCGKKATMNIRIDESGATVREGDQVEIGGNDRYIAVCRKHFKQGKTK